ncbi:hypothetical protein ONV78_22055 [Hahella sp. CR1]|uniref:hypothetical protein n=1 Tax=Hahella sp. CR1 TaxID=2992807 RepID=UPI002442BA8B|nr:hypothetical protein [Hahella sp. CR1]MDG9670438.1 hypothetical protein [Hahella sp. CR1]
MINQLLKPALTGKGPNFAELTAKECRIGRYDLHYKLPGNVIDIGRARRPKPTQLNLQQGLFSSYETMQRFNRAFVQIEFEWWAYRGLFLQGHFGKLSDMSVTIDVNRSEPQSPLVEGDLDSLETYLKKDLWDYYETEKNKDGKPGANWEARYAFEHPEEMSAQGYIPLGKLVLVTHLPEVYYRQEINGVDWLHYGIRGEGVGRGLNYYWAYPLGAGYYLTFNFHLTSEVGDKELRYQRMYEDAKRIMSMVALRKA